MSQLNPDGPVHPGREAVEITQHAMNGVGPAEAGFPPRVVLSLPNSSTVLEADDADAVASELSSGARAARTTAGLPAATADPRSTSGPASPAAEPSTGARRSLLAELLVELAPTAALTAARRAVEAADPDYTDPGALALTVWAIELINQVSEGSR